jgi:hypothetical protein
MEGSYSFMFLPEKVPVPVNRRPGGLQNQYGHGGKDIAGMNNNMKQFLCARTI